MREGEVGSFLGSHQRCLCAVTFSVMFEQNDGKRKLSSIKFSGLGTRSHNHLTLICLQ